MSDQSTKVAKRAVHENIEMLPREGHVLVRNASHENPEEHEYRVEIGICGDAASCTCPDYEHRREPRGELCKHMKRVQLADPVREAANTNPFR